MELEAGIERSLRVSWKGKLHFCLLCSTGITNPTLLHVAGELGMHSSLEIKEAPGNTLPSKHLLESLKLPPVVSQPQSPPPVAGLIPTSPKDRQGGEGC